MKPYLINDLTLIGWPDLKIISDVTDEEIALPKFTNYSDLKPNEFPK